MRLFRAVSTKPSAWALGENFCEGDDFPVDLVGELVEARDSGLSVFTAMNPIEESLASVAAALWLKTQQQEKAYSFRIIEGSFVTALGGTVMKTPADFDFPDLNSYHHEITGLNGQSSVQVVKHMLEEGPVEVPALRVLQEIASLLGRHKISFNKIKVDGLKSLSKRDLLRAV